MVQIPNLEISKFLLQTLNNLYEIERKLSKHGDVGNVGRNVEKIKEAFRSDAGIFYEDPMGQQFKETRTDLEATISGLTADDLYVTEVIKPIIRFGQAELSRVVQRGIVVVESRKQGGTTNG